MCTQYLSLPYGIKLKINEKKEKNKRFQYNKQCSYITTQETINYKKRKRQKNTQINMKPITKLEQHCIIREHRRIHSNIIDKKQKS